MILSILLTAGVTLLVNEVTGVSPWLAIRLVRWAAKHVYVSDTDRAAQRQEEWEALIGSIPTNISKLLFGLGFACAGLYYIALRHLPTPLETTSKLIDEALGVLDYHEEFTTGVICAWVVIGSTSMPFLDWLIASGALFGLMFALIGLGAICEVTAATIRQHI
jgi:hypothetical protein